MRYALHYDIKIVRNYKAAGIAVQNTPLIHTVSHDDEIDLFELAENLYKQKLFIIFISVLATVLSVAVALMLPESYTTHAVVNIPPQGSLNTWNSHISRLQRTSESSTEEKEKQQEHPLFKNLYIGQETSYRDFQRFLTSPATKRSAFKQSALFRMPTNEGAAPDEKAVEGRYKNFLKKLSVSVEKKGSRTTVSYSSRKAEESARVINDLLIPQAKAQYIASLKDSYLSSVDTVKKQLLTEIKRKEARFKSANQQRLTELQEALKGAIAGDIKELRTSEITPTVLNNASYLLGSKILKSRIDTVSNRLDQYRFYSLENAGTATQKAYISGVDSLVFQLKQLNLLKVDFDAIQPYTLEQAAPVPVLPSKPKKTLIVAIGLILGLMLGVFAALLKIAIRGRKERLEQADQMQKLMADPA
nr:Wzz/FepE/Etk N-terminal domain-containing protein [Endozoicomonas sp. OPT23]